MINYLVFVLNRYDLKRSEAEVIKSEEADIEKFFKVELLHQKPGEFWDEFDYEVIEDGNVLVDDGEEMGFYIKKLPN